MPLTRRQTLAALGGPQGAGKIRHVELPGYKGKPAW